MKEENETIIRALNKYGRVPQTYELLNEIERLNNIIEELGKWIQRQAVENDDSTIISKSYKFALYNILDKLQELKERK